jgi:hypothetical protein
VPDADDRPRPHFTPEGAAFVDRVLAELSYQPSDIPGYFFLIFPLERGAEDLARGVLGGVTGITDSGQMLYRFGGFRNAMLIMDGEETVRLNRLSRVMHDNPHYFLSNNMAALYRVFQSAGPEDKLSRRQVMLNLLGYVFAAMKKHGSSAGRMFAQWAAEQTAFHQDVADWYSEHPAPIDGAQDLVRWLLRRGLEGGFQAAPWRRDQEWARKTWNEIPVGEWQRAVLDGLRYVGEVYRSEGEWLVKDRTLRVPPGSRLLLKRPPETWPSTRARDDAVETLVAQHGLDRKYKVQYMSDARFGQAQTAFHQALRRRRERS